MPDHDHIPGWPASMPADLPIEEARDIERRQVLRNVRHLAALVEVMRHQQKSTDDAIAGLRRDNERQFQSIGHRLDENTAITAETKEVLTAVKTGSRVLRWFKNALLGFGALSAALIAIWSLFELINK